MTNYSFEWKKDLKLRQISYNDFVSLKFSNGIFSVKVDGLLGAFIFKKGEKSRFQTSGGNYITSIPAITEYEVLLRNLGVREAIILGDLAATKSGQILPFNYSQSIVKTFYNQENQDLIFHYPADIYSLNGKRISYKEALLFLNRNIGKRGLPHIRMAKFGQGDMNVFRTLYDEVKDKIGYDGIIGRDVDGKNYKIKFTGTIDLVVIGAGHEDMKAWKNKQISYLLTSFIDKNGLFRTSSKVGSGFTQRSRIALYKFIHKYKLYQRNGEIFIPPKLVIEVKYFRYRLINTPTYRFSNNEYLDSGSNLSITLSNSSFERLRDDKKPNKFDARLEQIPEFKY